LVGADVLRGDVPAVCRELQPFWRTSSGSLAKFAAIRRASSLVSSLAAERRRGVVLEIDVSERLPGAIAGDEAGFCDDHPSWPLPGCRIKWVCYRVTHNFPSEKMARPSQRTCLVVTESDDVFGLECDNEVHAIAPNGYSPAKRVKSPSERVLAKH
jgi:hypothetical protein